MQNDVYCKRYSSRAKVRTSGVVRSVDVGPAGEKIVISTQAAAS